MIPEYIAYFLVKLSVYAVILPAGVALLRWRKLAYPTQRFLGYLSLYWLVSSLTHSALRENGINNLVWSHFTGIVELVLFLGMFQQWLSRRTRHLLLGTLVLIGATGTLVFFALTQQNLLLEIGQALMLIGISIYFFITEMRSDSRPDWLKRPIVWVAIGNLFYFSCAAVFLLLFNWLWENGFVDALKSLSGLNSFFLILQFVFFTIALWIQVPPEAKRTSSTLL